MEMMKAAVATGFGDIDTHISVRTDWPRPKLPENEDDVDTASTKQSSYLLLRVLACALAPGDVRVLSGKTDYVQLPTGGHPYVIGSDVSGIVAQVCGSMDDDSDHSTRFQIGDRVIARFDEPKPTGGVAEYRWVRQDLSTHAPVSLSPIQACTLPASAMAAKVLAQAYVQDNSNGARHTRVLILGGAGGVGTFLCQYVKLYGASYVAATSTQTALLASLGVDRVIDYHTENWWELPEFHDNKFDVVLDLVNGDNWEKGGCSGKAIRRDGVYAQLLTGVETEIVVHGRMDMVRLGLEFVGRMMYSRLVPWVPRWEAPEGLALKDGDLKELVRDVDEGRIQVVLDPASPFPFTQDGVRQAMKLQKSIHAHGKVVIQIAEDSMYR